MQKSSEDDGVKALAKTLGAFSYSSTRVYVWYGPASTDTELVVLTPAITANTNTACVMSIGVVSPPPPPVHGKLLRPRACAACVGDFHLSVD